jgi:hypothetical protein
LDEGKLFFAKGEGAHIEPFYYLSILGSINWLCIFVRILWLCNILWKE